MSFSVIIPKLGKLTGPTRESLVEPFIEARDANGVGASEIGSRWKIKDANGRDAGALSYNGKVWAI